MTTLSLQKKTTENSILRCILGVSAAFVLSTSLAYPAPHLSAIFSLTFLAPQKNVLSWKQIIVILALVYFLAYGGLAVGNYLIDFPLVIIPLMGLVIFWTFKFKQIPQTIRLVFLLLFILIPFMAIRANSLGELVFDVLCLNLAVGLLMAKIAFALIPDVCTEKAQEKPLKQEAYYDTDKLAFNGVLVLLPVVLLAYFYPGMVATLTLVFVVLLGFDPFIYQTTKVKGILFANVIGGLFAMLCYAVLVISPSYLLYVLLTIGAAFFFVPRLFSKRPIAPVFKPGFNTFFVIMAIVSTSDSSAGEELWSRILQIGFALTYVTLAYRWVNTVHCPELKGLE